MAMKEKFVSFIGTLDSFPKSPITTYIEDRVLEIEKLSKGLKRKKNKTTKFKTLTEYGDKVQQFEAPGCDPVQVQANSTRLSAVLESGIQEHPGNAGSQSSTQMPAPKESRVRRAAAEISIKKCCAAVQLSVGKKLRRPTESDNSVTSFYQTEVPNGAKLASTKRDFPHCHVSLKRLTRKEIQSWDELIDENQNGQAVKKKVSPTESSSQITTCVFPSPTFSESTSGDDKQRDSVERKMTAETARAHLASVNSLESTAEAVGVSNDVEKQVALSSSQNSKATTPSARKPKEPLPTDPSETAPHTDTNMRRSSLRKSKEAAELESVVEKMKGSNVEVVQSEVTDRVDGEVNEPTRKSSKLVSLSTSSPAVTKGTKEVESHSLREDKSFSTADKKSNQSDKLVEVCNDGITLALPCTDITTTNEGENTGIERSKLSKAPVNDEQISPTRKGKLTRTKTKMPEEDPTVPEVTQDATSKRTRTKMKNLTENENRDIDVPVEEGKRTRTKARKKKEGAEAQKDNVVNQDPYSMLPKEGERSFKVANASFSMPAASSTPRGVKRKSDWLENSPCIDEEKNAARSRTKVLSKPTVPGPLPTAVHPTSSAPLVKTQAASQTTESTRMTRTKTRQMKEASLNDLEVSSNTGLLSAAASLTNKVKMIKTDKENTLFRKPPLQMPRSEMKPRTTPLKLCNNLFTHGKILPSSAKAFSTLKYDNMKRNEEYDLKIREKIEKEQIAFKKKEEHIKSVSEKAKRNRELKKKKLEAQKRMMEEEKREQENKLERERIEKEQQVKAEKERQREEIAKKKKINQLKLQEAENRRQREEQIKLLRLKEQEEEARRQAEVRKRQEEEAERLAKQRLAEQQKWQNTKNNVPSKPAAVNKDEYELTPARGEKPPLPPKNVNDYGISDCDTDESSDDESRPKKVVPAWAEDGSRCVTVQIQNMVTADVFTKLMVVDNKAPTSRDLLQVDMQRPRNSSFHWPSSPI